jgi:hypothetical protein
LRRIILGIIRLLLYCIALIAGGAIYWLIVVNTESYSPTSNNI